MKIIILNFLSVLLTSLSLANPTYVSISYREELVKAGFTSPIVEISINGVTGLFLIDSGASVNVMADWFANDSSVKSLEEVQTSDSSGENQQTSIIQTDIFIPIKAKKGLKFSDLIFIRVSLPEVFETHRVAGIIAPQQLLAKKEVLYLNLTSPSLVIGPIESLKGKLRKPVSLKVISEDGPRGTQTVLYIAEVIINGYKTHLIVDTGADITGVGFDTGTGKKLKKGAVESTEKSGGIHGQPQQVWIVPSATLKFFKKSVTTDIRLLSTSKKMPADGMLGMQALKTCALLLAKSFGLAECR